MKQLVTIILCCLFFHLSQAQHYWQQQVHYTIDVTLHDSDNSLTGFEKMVYINHSPDTLHYIWMHVWMNAYKNDRTAFSEQMLKNGSTDFYFSDEAEKGYTNQLNFMADDNVLNIAADSSNIDILKLHLHAPLLPNDSVIITTPFHVKLPYNFSRGGHVDQTYQITQWYPKPAVYDSKGWHAMPYLDQGEFYSEFGNYNVNITLPSNYIVAASGDLQNQDELNKLIELGKTDAEKQTNYTFYKKKKNALKGKRTTIQSFMPASAKQTKTLSYTLNNAHDFAWFASKLFVVSYDTIQLNNHAVNAFSFYHPWQKNAWNKSTGYIKDAVHFYSNKIADYPYDIVSAVAGNNEVNSGGMEYPTITLITTSEEGKELDVTITHEVGHNWFYGILGTNERDHAWMDEGINSYYQQQYEQYKYGRNKADLFPNHSPENFNELLIRSVEKLKKDQPIDTTSAAYSGLNYDLMVYEKTPIWLNALRKQLGNEIFDSCMKTYYQQWQYKHPYPENFKQTIEQTSNTNISALYKHLYKTGPIEDTAIKKKIKLTALFNLKSTDKYNYVSIAPLLGFNNYDKLMIGGMVHNYQLPLNKFNFFIAPLYATGTSQLNGTARASYNIFKRAYWLETSTSFTKYTVDKYNDNGNNIYLGLQRITPSVKLTLYDKDVRSTRRWVLQARSFILKEDHLNFSTVITPPDTLNIVSKSATTTVINQLKAEVLNNRVLYPYDANFTLDQSDEFLRATFTAKYFFNYNAKAEGLTARFFAGKFFYLTSKNYNSAYATDRYHLNMTGPKGSEDYTYSDYFIGRNEYQGWMSQQIMERDGFFKVSTDLLSDKVGKTDNWLMALNLSGDIPNIINPFKILPFKLPIKLFVDVGTNADTWKDSSATGKFVYDAGVQLSLFKSTVNIYIPIFYSKVYSDYYKSVLGPNYFWQTVSFNINLQAFRLNNLSRQIPL